MRVEKSGPVTTIILARPEVRNAVDAATARELRAGLERFEADDDARALILTGAGGEAFCAGADLKAMDLDVDDPAGPMGFSRLAASKPILAAIAGHAVAGGLELACLCDLRIVEESAVMGVFCRRWGVPLIDGGTQRLPRVIGLGRALDLILSGRPVGAEEAERIGLVTAVTAPGGHLERALELAETLAAFPQETMLADRRAAIEGLGMPLADGLALEDRLGRETLAVAVRGAARFAGGAGRHGGPADTPAPDAGSDG